MSSDCSECEEAQGKEATAVSLLDVLKALKTLELNCWREALTNRAGKHQKMLSSTSSEPESVKQRVRENPVESLVMSSTK